MSFFWRAHERRHGPPCKPTSKNKPTCTLDGSLARAVLPIRSTCVHSVGSFLKKLKISVTSHQPWADSGQTTLLMVRLFSSFKKASFSSFSPSLNIVFKRFSSKASQRSNDFLKRFLKLAVLSKPRYSIDSRIPTQLLLAAANRASCSLRVACCFNFETDISIAILLFFFFFGLTIRPRSANQLVLIHGDASRSVCQFSRGSGQEAFFYEDVFCAWTVGDTALLSVLRVELGDYESLNLEASHLYSRDWKTQANSGAMSVFTSNMIERSRGSGLELVTPYQPSNTHAPTRSNDVDSSGHGSIRLKRFHARLPELFPVLCVTVTVRGGLAYRILCIINIFSKK